MASTRIMIVDDDVQPLTAYARTLRLAGYTVWTARTAEAALALCDEHSFDLVILDFLMPSMDGIELLTRIRRRRPLVRAIIVSGKIDDSVDEQQIAKALQAADVEAHAYLHKPVTNERLRETVAHLLVQNRPGTWREIAQDVVRGKKARLKIAKRAGRELKKLKKKPKK